MYLLGYDVGSSSVKACLVDIESGKAVASAFYPKHESTIISLKAGWAEQDPENWWENLKLATADVLSQVRSQSGGSTPLTNRGSDSLTKRGSDSLTNRVPDSLTKRSLSGAEGPAVPAKKQRPKTTTPKKATDTHLIDELFRQATELFE